MKALMREIREFLSPSPFKLALEINYPLSQERGIQSIGCRAQQPFFATP